MYKGKLTAGAPNTENALYKASSIYAVIDNAPSADVAPVRHGRWNDGDPYCPICRKDKFRGLDADVWADWQPDYCPNCGAKMDRNVEWKEGVD